MDRFDDPKNYRQKRESFTRSLQHFHETRGTPFRRIPQFCGKEVDLFRLYNVVTQRGGWIKVNRTNQWEELLEDFNIPKDCVNGGNALKQIYLRYLDRYEKVHYLGESGDRHDEEEDIESRHRRWSARSMHTVPLTYNYHQHIVVDNLRKFNNLSSDIYKASDYDRLALSLVSPLPNEQDFAINVCTILASEGKHTLKLEKCPRIMDYLLAHAGVYNHSNLRELFEEIYGSVRGHSLSTFWSDVIETKELLDLTDETRFIKKPPRKLKVIKVVKSSEHGTNINQDNPPNIPQSYSATPKKSDRTIAAIEAPSTGETKENSTMDVRISEPSDNNNKNNSIQDTLNVENQGVCNSINNNEKTVLGADKIETNVLIDLTDNDSKVKNDGCEGESESKADTCLKVQDMETTNNDVVSLNNESNDVVVTNLPEKSLSDSVSEVENKTANDNPSSSTEVTTTEVKNVEEVTGSEEVKVEDVVMETEEERIAREKELAEKLERERIEAEERRKKEEEEAEERRKKEEEEAEERRKREEEEAKIRAIEEAKRIEKETKEAEIYEAMLREEEKKKKPYLYEELPAKRPRRAVKSTLKIEPEDMELFCLGRENGTRDYIGQRVLQVANIFRDLTFCEESVPLMAKNTAFLRFLLLCANSKWSCLHQLGLDMLGNISPELTIEDPAIDRIFQAFFWTVYRGIHHSNRFMVLSCLEILNKICQKDENEEIVSRNLDQNIYDQICRLLTLHDVMILLYTLECLYSMSSMGEKACTFICRSKGAMEMLLAFVTVEAQYYGKEGCILMKVIETRPRGEPVNPPPVQPPPSASPGPGPPFSTTVLQNTPQSFPSMVTTSTMTVQQAPVQKIFTPNIIRTPAPKAMVGVPMAAVATPVQLPPNACPPLVQTMPSVQQQHAHQQTVQENEQFALAWIRATFELSAGGKVEQQDLYKRYVDSCAKMGRKGVIAAMHFPRFVRSVFGGTVGPKSHPIPISEQKPGGPISQSFYEGIKVTQRQQQQQQQQQQKILQQQLQAKPSETSIKGRLVKINGVIQESPGPTPENHLVAINVKGKKEPPQPPTSSTATTLGNLLRPKTPKIDGEDSDSMASTSIDCTTTGGGNVSSNDDNDNSLTSFEGMFNGIQESLDFDATVSSVVEENCVKKVSNEDNSQKPNDKQKSAAGTTDGNHLKQPDNKPSMTEGNCVKPAPMPNKSLMLADLLDKKDSPALNGVLGKDLRIGEKGLELVEKAILKETHLNNKDISVNCKKDTVVSVNGDTRTGGECVTVINNENPSLQSGSKRTANEGSSDETESKRPRIENETKDALAEKKEIESEGSKKSEDDKKKDDKEEINGEEEVRASSTAANLFAALAAEALEDETDLEVPSEPNPQPQTVMVPGGQIRNVYLGDSSPLIGQIIMAPGQLQQGQVQLQQRQVLFSTGGQSLPVIYQNQRIVQGSSGQMIVTSQPQQYIMSGNMQSQMVIAPTQTALVQGQTQTVLVASATPQQPGTKTIIILQPQSQNNTNSQQQKMMVTSQGPQMVVTQVPRQVVQTQPTPPPTTLASSTIVASSSTALRDSLTTDVVLNSGIQNNPPVPPLHQNGSQIQVISSGVQNNAPILNQSGGDKSKVANNNVATVKTVPGANSSNEIIFLCEWRGCMRSFKTASEVYLHVCSAHVPRDSETETQCLWERCDGMKRKRFSLMTHLSDRHCNPGILTMMAERRRQLSTQGRSDIPAPVPPPAHPGHPPNAAFVAIARNAREMGNPKELMKTNGGKVAPPPPPPPPLPPPPPPSAVLLAKAASPPVQVKDDVEGPVTKSIRLTASLILRNLVIYSSIGRRFLKGYEPHLANIALSNVESSRTIAQVLADLNDSSSR